MIVLEIIGGIVAPLLLAIMGSTHVARVVAIALLAHADALNAYREELHSRARHWHREATASVEDCA